MAYAHTIISNIKSNGTSPYAYYTVTAEAVRINATAITVKLNVQARLASGSSSLGTGGTMGLDSYFYLNSQTKGALRIKATNASWSGSSWHCKTTSYTVNNVTATTSSIGTCFRTTRTGSKANTTSTSDGCWTSWRKGSNLPIPIWVYYTYNANGGSSTPSGGGLSSGGTITLANAISHDDTTANGYTVTYNGNGGTPSTGSQTATDTTSYSFAGWKCSLNDTTYSAGATSPSLTADTTFTAQWTTSTTKGSLTSPTWSKTNGTSTRTVTFNAAANGGTCSTSSLNSTASITYSGSGWYTSTSAGTKRCGNGVSYTPSATETLYQQYTSSTGNFSSITLPSASKTNGTATRTVTFNATDNGGTCSTPSLNSTATITYSQSGWYTSSTGGSSRGNAGDSYTPSGSEIVYAQFNSSTGSYSAITLPSATHESRTATITVLINGNGGTPDLDPRTSTTTVTYSQTGWWTASSGGTNRGNAGATYTPTSAETIYAQFSSSTGPYSTVTLPTASECTRTGYVLLGFDTNSTATTATYLPGASYTPVPGSNVLYAIWKTAQASISIKNNGNWVQGPVYIKVNGAWVAAEKVFIKDNGTWVESSN